VLRIALSFGFGLGSAVYAAPPTSISYLSEGIPGCWEEFHSGALTTEELKKFSKECLQMRRDYFASVELVKKDPKKFEKKLIEAIVDAKKAQPPYEAILFATLVQTEEAPSSALKDALTKRAEVEAKLKVLYPYAQAALFRLKNQNCDKDPKFSKKIYLELCEVSDDILSTFFNAKPPVAEAK
jgi:hypothetical protein